MPSPDEPIASLTDQYAARLTTAITNLARDEAGAINRSKIPPALRANP
ncbi:hypothetical protein OG474_05570 [Kribbella sp. NBC_01505]